MRGHWLRFDQIDLTAAHALVFVVAAVLLAAGLTCVVILERRRGRDHPSEGAHAG